MTKRDLQELDPELQRLIGIVKWLVIGVLGAMVLLGGAVAGTFFRGESTRNIVTKTDCAIDPNGEPCQELKRETDENRSVADTCIIAYKLDRDGRLLALTKCPPEEAPSAEGTTTPSSPPRQSETTTSTGVGVRGSQSPDDIGTGKGTPRGSDKPPSDTSPGKSPEEPGQDTGSPPSVDGDSQEEPVADEPAQDSPGKSGLVKPTTDGLGETVKEVGKAAGDTVKQTGQAAETVLDPCKGVVKQLCK
jgi:hypothetical protein